MNLYEQTNNPLNIRFTTANHWKGQTSSYHGFVVFKNTDYGYRAAYVLLCAYIRKGYDTIRAIVSRYAPPSENDTENYIKYVCSETMISPDAKLKTETQYDYWTLLLIIAAMARMENGISVQPQDINLALGKVL